MDYISAAEAAEKWNTGLRQVQRLLVAGRSPGAKKLGNSWVIPTDAEKPGDSRLEKKQAPQSTVQDVLSRVNGMGFLKFPRDDPYRALSTITDEKLRLMPEAVLAYMRGNFEQVQQCYAETAGDDLAKLLMSAIAIPAAISLGNYPFFLEIESWLKGVIKNDFDACTTAFAELALANGYISAFAPGMVAEWIKNGDFTALHKLSRYDANFSRVIYFQCIKNYESMLYTAQATLSLLGMVSSEKEFSITEITLRIRCAIACYYLDRTKEAKQYLLETMDIALPHGFITQFAETITALGGLTEQCLKQSYPQWYDAVVEQAHSTIANWVTFHNQFTKDNITLILTVQEYHVANLVARKIPRARIAKQLNYSEGWVDKTVNTIYEKLLISNRDDLAKYIL